MSKVTDFNDFRFGGLNWHKYTNNYITMDRVSEDETKIVVKVDDGHLIKTQFGYALVLDKTRVVFLKEWQVSANYFGNEVLIDKNFWNVKVWGEHENFDENEENLNFDTWLDIAKEQSKRDEDNCLINPVKW